MSLLCVNASLLYVNTSLLCGNRSLLCVKMSLLCGDTSLLHTHNVNKWVLVRNSIVHIIDRCPVYIRRSKGAPDEFGFAHICYTQMCMNIHARVHLSCFWV